MYPTSINHSFTILNENQKAISFTLREQDDDEESSDVPFTFLEVEGHKSEGNIFEKFINQPSTTQQQRNQSETVHSQNQNDPTQK